MVIPAQGVGELPAAPMRWRSGLAQTKPQMPAADRWRATARSKQGEQGARRSLATANRMQGEPGGRDGLGEVAVHRRAGPLALAGAQKPESRES